MTQLNVRLDEEDARKAEALRAAGIPVSAVVREAIRREHERLTKARSEGKRASEVVRAILTELPDLDAPERPLDTSDRRAVARAIRAKLGR